MTGHPRALRALGLFGLLVAVYFATYSGQPVSVDELWLIDAGQSLLRSGTPELAYTNDLRNYHTLPGDMPVGLLNMEPMQTYAALPLLWLAKHLPGIGLLQAAWLLNTLVTALAAVVLYGYGAALGYTDRAALGVALAFGLGTIVWPYSQLFFREPLLMLFGLLSAYALERWRQRLAQGGGAWRAFAWLGAAILAFVGGILTKDAALVFIPALLIAAIPTTLARRAARLPRYGLLLVTLGGGGLIALVVAARIPSIAARLPDASRLGELLGYTVDALPAYLLSPGFSLWAFSPVLLLGLVGAYRLLRARRIRLVVVPLVVLGAFILGYATLHGQYWYGGLGWGPRFLVPVTPFLALWLLPIAEPLLAQTGRRWTRAVAAGILAQSVCVQLLGVTVPVQTFSSFLYVEGPRLGRPLLPWQDGVWNPLYIPQVVTAHQAARVPSALAWSVNGVGQIVLPLCVLAAGAGLLAMARWLRSWRGWGVRAGLVGLTMAILLGGGLRLYYRDPRFGGDDELLWKVLQALREHVQPGDVVILSNPTYRPFFMNYYTLDAPIYALPNSPGELINPGEAPFVVSDDMEERAEPYFQIMFSRIALDTSRWWFLTEYTPFSTERYRVTENYLARHYFPAAEVVSEPRARLILYAPISAPPDWLPPWPENPVGADFGAATLVGFDLPRGAATRPGALLPVSLVWRHDGWPDGLEPFDYSVNLSLIDGAGATRAQRAVTPLGSFGKMTHWQPGGYYRDNHALQVPADLPPGEYTLWALIFDWRDGRNLPLRDRPGDYVVLATVRIE